MLFAKRRLKKGGERATALVLSCEERSKVTTNELRDYDYVLEVHPESGETFQAKVRDKFWITGLRPENGDDGVPVRFDPGQQGDRLRPGRRSALRRRRDERADGAAEGGDPGAQAAAPGLTRSGQSRRGGLPYP